MVRVASKLIEHYISSLEAKKTPYEYDVLRGRQTNSGTRRGDQGKY